MKRYLVILALLASSSAHAYGYFVGTVNDVRIDRDGRGIIAFSGLVVGTPATCRAPSYDSHFSFDTNMVGGKAIYSMALAAASSGKAVTAFGTGSCNDYLNTVEALLYWHYHN